MRGTKADGPEEATIVSIDPSGVAIVENTEGLSDEVFIKEYRLLVPEAEVTPERRNESSQIKL